MSQTSGSPDKDTKKGSVDLFSCVLAFYERLFCARILWKTLSRKIRNYHLQFMAKRAVSSLMKSEFKRPSSESASCPNTFLALGVEETGAFPFSSNFFSPPPYAPPPFSPSTPFIFFILPTTSFSSSFFSFLFFSIIITTTTFHFWISPEFEVRRVGSGRRRTVAPRFRRLFVQEV